MLHSQVSLNQFYALYIFYTGSFYENQFYGEKFCKLKQELIGVPVIIQGVKFVGEREYSFELNLHWVVPYLVIY